MKKSFVESSEFTEWVVEFLPDQDYASFQRMLAANPDAGDVMAGCGGLRKIRWSDPRRQKGKRGGVRVIYLHVEKANRIFLLDVYAKGEKEDLSAEEKKHLKRLAETLKLEAVQAMPSQRGKPRQ